MTTAPHAREPHPLTHRYADVGGLMLHYVEAGTGPLVVLLHGFPEFWFAWRSQIAPLAAAGYRVVAPDLRGYNLSDTPPRVSDYAVEKLSGDVAALIAALDEREAIVVGHDWGALVAWDFAMNHPERLAGLAILNVPHPVSMLRGLRTLRQLKKSWYALAFQVPGSAPERVMSAHGFARLRDTLREGVVRPLPPADVDAYVEALSRPGALTAAINYYRAAGRAMLLAPMRRVRRIDLPVLVIWGEDDPYLGAELAAPDPRWVPNARVERVAGAGHFVHWDAAPRVNELLLAYARDRSRAPA